MAPASSSSHSAGASKSRFRNGDAAPHSARVVAASDPVPLVPGRSVFAGAQTKNPEAGILSGDGDQFSFTADRAGNYLIACAVPGHAAAGMYSEARRERGGGETGVQVSVRELEWVGGAVGQAGAVEGCG